MRFERAFILVAITTSFSISGCSKSSEGPPDLNRIDLRAASLDLVGRIASQFSFSVSAGDGGATPSTLEALALWSILPFTPSASAPVEIDTGWQFCKIKFDSGVTAPYDDQGLLYLTATTNNGSLLGAGDGAMFHQASFAFFGGALLTAAGSLTDPLPTTAGPVCSKTLRTGCLWMPTLPDGTPVGTIPGVRINASGLSPDADYLWIDFRLTTAFDATALVDGSLDGTVSSASLEYHVLNCHLRSGQMCAPADVTALEAAHPPLTITGGTVRSHRQGIYFTCDRLLTDVQGAIAGLEPMDAGVSTDLGGLSFSIIQEDMNLLGCATCHEPLHGPGQLHLFHLPETPTLIQQNYEAIKPWTTADSVSRQLGGRFVNQTPLPGPIRDRWLQWISEGMPF